MRSHFSLLFFAVLLVGCKQSIDVDAKKSCLNELCAGEAYPKAPVGFIAEKANGIWYFVPREYYAGERYLAFSWPSKTPVARWGGDQKFYGASVGVQYWPAPSVPPSPRGMDLVEFARAGGHIQRVTVPRRGLEIVEMKNVTGPDGYSLGTSIYYVATEIKGTDGRPPVAHCSKTMRDGGGASFVWQDGLWWGIRMNLATCDDWPEIYLEAIRVLEMIRKG